VSYSCHLLISDAQPTENEQKTFAIVQKVLKNSETILDELQQYKGAGKEIREVGFVYFHLTGN
jgi:CYRIA/CYRIB Rac1 binding domain